MIGCADDIRRYECGYAPTPVFAYNAETPMAAEGIAAAAGAGPDVSAAGTTSMGRSRDRV